MIGPLDLGATPDVKPGCDEHRVELIMELLKRDVSADSSAAANIDSQGPDVADILVQVLVREPILRYAVTECPAC